MNTPMGPVLGARIAADAAKMPDLAAALAGGVIAVTRQQHSSEFSLLAWPMNSEENPAEAIRNLTAAVRIAAAEVKSEAILRVNVVVPEKRRDGVGSALVMALFREIGAQLPAFDVLFQEQGSKLCILVGQPGEILRSIKWSDTPWSDRIGEISKQVDPARLNIPIDSIFAAQARDTQLNCWFGALDAVLAAEKKNEIVLADSWHPNEAAAMGWALGFVGVTKPIYYRYEDRKILLNPAQG